MSNGQLISLGKSRLWSQHCQIDSCYTEWSLSPIYIYTCLSFPSRIPYVGTYIQAPFSEYLEKQKLRLHRRPGEGVIRVCCIPPPPPCPSHTHVIKLLFPDYSRQTWEQGRESCDPHFPSRLCRNPANSPGCLATSFWL